MNLQMNEAREGATGPWLYKFEAVERNATKRIDGGQPRPPIGSRR
jgi:hypothetical protein